MSLLLLLGLFKNTEKTMTLSKLAYKFEALLVRAQQQNVQSGEIADAFSIYFPNKNQTSSPLMNKLDAYLSQMLPEDINVSIGFLVKPGFKPDFSILLTRGAKPVQDLKLSNAIMQFLSNEMKNFSSEASAKFPGRTVDEALTIATHKL